MAEQQRPAFRVLLLVSEDSEYACLSAEYSPLPGETHWRGHDMRDGDRAEVFAEARQLLDYLERYPLKTPHDFRFGPEALRNSQDQ